MCCRNNNGCGRNFGGRGGWNGGNYGGRGGRGCGNWNKGGNWYDTDEAVLVQGCDRQLVDVAYQGNIPVFTLEEEEYNCGCNYR